MTASVPSPTTSATEFVRPSITARAVPTAWLAALPVPSANPSSLGSCPTSTANAMPFM